MNRTTLMRRVEEFGLDWPKSRCPQGQYGCMHDIPLLVASSSDSITYRAEHTPPRMQCKDPSEFKCNR